jgi:2-phospho-L-lactate guanylyltransferase
MQATVATFDPEDRSGTVRCDDGTELTYAASALARDGLRMLRSGQRVFVLLSPAGDVQTLSLWT